jgi:hypothetical protein
MVKLTDKHIGWQAVEADYFRVQDGSLFFRVEKRRDEQYNQAVRVFAPGFWAEVFDVALQNSVDAHHVRGYKDDPRD